MEIIYIASDGRSGSTILGNVLGQVNNLIHVGELFSFWSVSWPRNVQCGCGTNIRDCQFWREILRKSGIRSDADIDQINKYLKKILPRTHQIPYILGGESFRKISDHEISVIKSFYYNIIKLSGSQYIVDSSKAPYYLYFISKIANINTKIIHLVRDARAVNYSWHRKSIQGFSENWFSSALGWTARNSVMEYWRARTDDDLIQVTYERFAHNPRQTIDLLLEWIGIDETNPVSQTGGFHFSESHTVWGNPSRHKNGYINIELDNEWLTSMSWMRKRGVEAITWPLLLWYGYLTN